MFFRILKKDLKRKKGVNIILFLFILLAVVFVAGSVNNVLVVTNATQYCMERGKVPDDSIWTTDADIAAALEYWLKGDGKEYISGYTRERCVTVWTDNIKTFGGRDGTEYDIKDTIMLQAQWDSNMIMFDRNGKELVMEDGMIGMQAKEMERNGLEPGDKITFVFGDYERTFTLTEPILDPAFGGEYVGITRMVVSKEEFRKIAAPADGGDSVFCIRTDDVSTFSKELNSLGLNIFIETARNVFEMTYIMPIVVSVIMIIVGVCLIIIAFLVLRFTIMVTLEEDYREIGIMKAIGIKSRGITQLYLTKYIALSLVAAVTGGLISIPVSSGMLRIAASGMMMEDGTANILINALCAGAVMLVVMGYCYFTTGRLKRFTAMDAIRGGATGEQFGKTAVLLLHRHHRIFVPYFLALNDILTSLKRYIVMILTFMMGTVLIVLCSNAITTFGSEEMARNFLLDPSCQVYITVDSVVQEDVFSMTADEILEKADWVRQNFEEKGYEADVHTFAAYSASVYAEENEKDRRSFMAIYPRGTDAGFVELTGGTIPVMENEIVMSEKVMEKFGVSIGDAVHLEIGGKDYRMLVCGSYQNYMQMGQSILLSPNLDLGDEKITMGCFYFQVSISGYEGGDLLEEVQEDFPEYECEDAYGIVKRNIGGTVSAIAAVKTGVIVLMCMLCVLITVLMMKIFIMEERGQIAMLRSIGFSVWAVRLWQISRMGMVLLLGVVLGVAVSIPLNGVTIQPVFAIMGASHLRIQVEVWETYVLYPLLLLACVVLAACMSSVSIRKMNFMDINNME